MSYSDLSPAPSAAPSPDFLPPPPRSVAPSIRALRMRVGFLVGMMLGPLLALWIGQVSSEKLRTLAAQGRSTNGQVVMRS